MKKRALCIILSVMLAFQMMPAAAFATAGDSLAESQEAAVEQNAAADDSQGQDEQASSGADSNKDEGVAGAESTEDETAASKESSKKSSATTLADDGATAESASDFTITNFQMKWLADKSTGATVSDDGKTITLEPTSGEAGQTYAMAQYEMSFSGRDSGVIPAGSITVRIPAHLFKNRDGNLIMTPVSKKESGKSVTEPSGPEAPNTGTENSFNWTYDAETDEIVYTNFQDMSVHETFLVRIQYQIASTQVESGATADMGGASYNVKTDAMDAPMTGGTDEVHAVVNTSVKTPSATKTVEKKYEKWDSTWGEAPADADQYYYVVWKMRSNIRDSVTQAYKLVFDETKETNPDNTAEDEDLIAWTTGDASSSVTGTSNKWVQSYTDDQGTVLTGAQGMKSDVVFVTDPNEAGSTAGYNQAYHYRYAVVRYPKAATADNASPKSKNCFTAVAEGLEGSKAQEVNYATYSYQHVNYEYSGNKWSTDKGARSQDSLPYYGSYKQNGGLTALRNGMDYRGGSWIMGITNTQASEFNEDGTPKPASEQPDYYTVLSEGAMFIAGEELDGKNAQNPDYDINYFSLNKFQELEAKVDDEKGLYYEGVAKASDYHPIDVLVRTRDNGEWHSIGQITASSLVTAGSAGTYANKVTFNGQDYFFGDYYKIPLPEGTYDIKFEHKGSQHKVDFAVNLYDTLHPTDHVMSLIGDNTTQFDLINIDDAYIIDKDRNIISGGGKPTADSTQGIVDAMNANDTANYGDDAGNVVHKVARHSYQGLTTSSLSKKSMSLKEENSKEGYERIDVTLQAYDYLSLSGSTNAGVSVPKDDAVAMKAVTEHREMTFYELLPAGCTVDLTTLRVYPYGSTVYNAPSTAKTNFINCDNVKTYQADFQHTVEMVENWRDSGRTMMIVHAQMPDGVQNYTSSTAALQSGWYCRFDMIDSFESITSNGNKLNNNSAIASEDGPFSEGKDDNGQGSGVPDLLNGLTDAGGDADGKKNVLYADADITVNPTVGAEFKYKKYVKNSEEAVYKQSTDVYATGSYSYQLLVKNDTNNRQSGIILYDLLEDYETSSKGVERPNWEGHLTGIDYSQATKLGADVVTYYSTADWGDGALDQSRADLSRTDLWTTTAPDDLSTVTAVAFDCRKALDTADANHKNANGDFVLPAEENLACYLYMQAPENYKDYQDDPATTDKDETHKAYNSSFIMSQTYGAGDPVDGSSTEKLTQSQETTVTIKGPSVELDKNSDPASGTVTKPAKVEAGDPVTFTLDVKNKALADAVTNVVVEDTIPTGLTINASDIKYYSGDHVTNQKPCDGTGLVTFTQDGQKLVFTISKVAARETIHLVIPTTVDVTANTGMTYDNKSKITNYNGKEWEIESNETHHGSDPVLVSVKAKKNWSDNNNESGLRPSSITVQLYADGQAQEGKTATLNSSNSWKATFSNLPKYKDDGTTEIAYTVEEVEVDGYQASYSTADDGTLEVTNTAHRVDVNKEVAFKVKKLRANSTVTVPGVQYKLTRDEAGTDQIATATTDASGYASFNFTPEGEASYDVWLTEVSAPHGYTVDTTPVKVQLKRATDPVWSLVDGVQTATYPWSVTIAGDQWNAANNTLTRTNVYTPDPVDLTIPVKKDIAGNATPNDKKFTFTLAAKTSGAPLPQREGSTVTVNGAAEGTFGTITFTKAGTYKYTVKETAGTDTGYAYDGTTHEVEADVTDTNGVLSVKWKLDGTLAGTDTKVTFTNTYTPSPVKVTIPVSKKVTGTTHTAMKDFTFQLAAITAQAPMPASDTVTFAEKGSTIATDRFGSITYRQVGTYYYKVTEVNTGEAGYGYDTSELYVRVTVTDDNGTLKAKAEYGTLAGDAFTAADATSAGLFTNTYSPTPATLTIPVRKNITGNERPADQLRTFTFTLEADADTPNAPLPEGAGATAQVTDTGANHANGTFGEISFTEPGAYQYTVKETAGTDTGYAYDKTVRKLTVTVTDKGGALEAAWADNADADAKSAVFTNTYTPAPVSVQIPMQKALEGETPEGGWTESFEFDLAAKVAGEPMPAKGGEQATVVGQGSVKFGTITYTEAGTYSYEVTEKKEDKKGYVYDQAKHSVQVVVTDNNGVLEASLVVDGQTLVDDASITYTNGYYPEAAVVEMPVSKAITGNARSDKWLKDFEFELVPAAGNSALAGTDTTATGSSLSLKYDKTYTTSIDDEGEAVLGDIPIGKIGADGTGELVYTVKEKAGNAPGYTYDTKEYTLKITSTHSEGTFIARCSLYDGDNLIDQWSCNDQGYMAEQQGDKPPVAEFTNAYDPTDATLSLPVTKSITGADRPGEKDFTFTLAAKTNGAPLPAAGGETATVTGEGTANFGEITFTAAGTYQYTIQENKGTDTGYTYDKTVRTVTVTVTDNNGVLEAAWADDADDDASAAAFANSYTPNPVTFQIPVTKSITGNERPADFKKTFEFTLTAQAGAPLPQGKGTVTTVRDEGAAQFGEVEYTQAGTYTYLVTETVGNETGYTYDQKTRTVVVEVTDEDGQLMANLKQQGADGLEDVAELAFTNNYTPQPTQVALPVEKAITGNDRTSGTKDFTFTLTADNGEPLPAEDGQSVTINDEGTASFGQIAFDHVGTYHYTVTEADGGATGYTYAEPRHVTVTVTDNDGVLVATWADDADADADTVKFTNDYTPTPAKVVLPAAKAIEGDPRPADFLKDFTFTLSANDGTPLPQGTGKVVTIKDEGTASFGEITFTKAGTFVYTVSEANDGETGYTYAGSHEVTVTVTDNDGVLEATWADGTDADADTVKFTNGYTPVATELALPVEKKIEGNDRTGGTKDFTFTLAADEDGTPMPADEGQTVTINDEGTASFGQIAFDHAGTYHYTVTEADGGATGYTYAAPRHVTVTVTDNDGVLEATWADDADADASTVCFANGYTPAATDLSLPVSKKIEGDTPSSKEAFQFKIEGEDGAPMPESELVSIEGEGSTAFGDIHFEKAGTYQYKVSEVASKAVGYDYDGTVYQVQVMVTDNDGVLEAAWTVDGKTLDGLTFTNAYTETQEKTPGEKPKTKTGHDGNTPVSDTGDNTSLAVLLLMLAASGTTWAVVRRRRKNLI